MDTIFYCNTVTLSLKRGEIKQQRGSSGLSVLLKNKVNQEKIKGALIECCYFSVVVVVVVKKSLMIYSTFQCSPQAAFWLQRKRDGKKTESSVTRFGEILPLWQKFISL